MAEVTITFTNVPDDQTPAGLARCGEFMGLEANGPEDNPSPQAWMRAGISAGMILRHARDGRMSLDLLVCLLAMNCDPDHDESTPERASLIGGHKSVEDEWANGPASVGSGG